MEKGGTFTTTVAWKLLTKSYPNFSEGYVLLPIDQKQLKIDSSTTVEQFKQSLANSAIYAEAEKKDLYKELKTLQE